MGRVVRVNGRKDSPGRSEIEFEVEESWKQFTGRRAVVLAVDSVERPPFRKDGRYVVFVDGEVVPGSPRLAKCTRTRLVSEAAADLKQLGVRKPLRLLPRAYTYCDKDPRMCGLRVHRDDLSRPVRFQVRELWHYEPRARKWHFMGLNTIEATTLTPEPVRGHDRSADPIARRLTDLYGLFWVKWLEDDVPYEDFLYSGMLCEDVMIGPMTKGDEVAACVPGEKSASAEYVPDPRVHCTLDRPHP
ncbi:MAG TPA: hypothetical protein VJV75_11310 [Candidatus Polarisedimenticolia bacterium]|nr:hypothetical protein [Candidatus Polarisedimenticolia bacterium]